MSKVGRQQISQKLLADIVEIVRSTSFVTLSNTEPEGTAEGSFWLQTGDGIFEQNPSPNPECPEPVRELIVANAVISDDEPLNFEPTAEIWFDIDE